MAGIPGMPTATSQMLGLRTPAPQGAPIIIGHPRLQQTHSPHMHQPQVSLASLMNGQGPPPLVSPTDGMLYSYDPYGLAAGTQLLQEYPGLEHSGAGTSASPFVR
jgi:hypothetical protein